MRTVFGKVAVRSPRLWTCQCDGARQRTISTLSQALPRRVTPELEYLQVKWSAHLSYKAATTLLKEILPLQSAISVTGAKRHLHTVGRQLDAQIESGIAKLPEPGEVARARESRQVTAVSVDSVWVRHCEPPKVCSHHVNIVTGRATLADGRSKVYGYVGKQVPSPASRLDQFLMGQGVKPNERVTVVSDGAGEFTKAVRGSRLARGRVLDWFHLAMKFQAAITTAQNKRGQDGPDWRWIEDELMSAKWLVWHGKGRKAIARLNAIVDALAPWPQHRYAHLSRNVCLLRGYLRWNRKYLVNYGTRRHKGLPIASSIAESAVNEVVSHRMAKRQQMRWTDEGAHCMVLVRVADINGELSPQSIAALPTLGSRGSRAVNDGLRLAA